MHSPHTPPCVHHSMHAELIVMSAVPKPSHVKCLRNGSYKVSQEILWQEPGLWNASWCMLPETVGQSSPLWRMGVMLLNGTAAPWTVGVFNGVINDHSRNWEGGLVPQATSPGYYAPAEIEECRLKFWPYTAHCRQTHANWQMLWARLWLCSMMPLEHVQV